MPASATRSRRGDTRSRLLALFVSSTVCLAALSAWLITARLGEVRADASFSTSDLDAAAILAAAQQRAGMFTPVPDPLVDMTFLPGLRERPSFATDVPLTTNDAGLRYPSTIGRKQPGVRRLVLLGDSFVAATAAHYEDGVAPQLQGILRRCSASSGPRWEVLPIAVGGWNLVSSAS